MTASLKDAPVTSPVELGALEDHAARCNGLRGRLFRLQCALDTVDAFLSRRVISVLVVAFVGVEILVSLVS